jgi:multisubunit Na+/H+ antiporter MnhB subunit
MKKVLIGLLIAGVTLGMALPALAQEQIPTSCTIRAETGISGCGGAGTSCSFTADDQCSLCCAISSLVYVTNWVFTILVLITVLLVIVGAFYILTSAGDTEKFNKGRDFIMYAAIGLGVALLAKAIPAIVRYVIGSA